MSQLTGQDLGQEAIVSIRKEAAAKPEEQWPARFVGDLAEQLLRTLRELDEERTANRLLTQDLRAARDHAQEQVELRVAYDRMNHRYREEKAVLQKEIDSLKDNAVLQHRERQKLAARLEQIAREKFAAGPRE